MAVAKIRFMHKYAMRRKFAQANEQLALEREKVNFNEINPLLQ